MARSSRLISRNPEPLTVFTNFPLGARTPSSKSLLPGTSIRWENRLRLCERRWAKLLLGDLVSFAGDDEAPIRILFVVDLHADVAIWGKNLNRRGSKASSDEDRRGFDEFLRLRVEDAWRRESQRKREKETFFY